MDTRRQREQRHTLARRRSPYSPPHCHHATLMRLVGAVGLPSSSGAAPTLDRPLAGAQQMYGTWMTAHQRQLHKLHESRFEYRGRVLTEAEQRAARPAEISLAQDRGLLAEMRVVWALRLAADGTADEGLAATRRRLADVMAAAARGDDVADDVDDVVSDVGDVVGNVVGNVVDHAPNYSRFSADGEETRQTTASPAARQPHHIAEAYHSCAGERRRDSTCAICNNAALLAAAQRNMI